MALRAAQIRLTDVRAVEDCLETLQRGNLAGEKGLSVKNCTQLFRLLQLAVEYLSHLRSAHAQLLARYEDTAQSAERCRGVAGRGGTGQRCQGRYQRECRVWRGAARPSIAAPDSGVCALRAPCIHPPSPVCPPSAPPRIDPPFPCASTPRWRWAAQSYLEAGQVFVGECMSMSAMSRQRLDQVDQTRADLDALDAQYNRVLDELEVRGAAGGAGGDPAGRQTRADLDALDTQYNRVLDELEVRGAAGGAGDPAGTGSSGVSQDGVLLPLLPQQVAPSPPQPSPSHNPASSLFGLKTGVRAYSTSTLCPPSARGPACALLSLPQAASRTQLAAGARNRLGRGAGQRRYSDHG